MSYYQKYIEWAIGNGGITVAQKRDIINLSRTAKVQLEDVCMTAFDKKVLPGSVIAVLKKHQSETPKPAVPVATPAPQPKIVPAKEKKTPKVDWKKVGSGGLVALKFVGRHGKRVVSGIGKIRIPKIRVGRKRLPASEKVIEVEKTESAEIEETPVKRQPEKKAVSAPKNSYARKVEEFGPEVDETTQDSVPIIAQVGTATLIPGTGPGASAPTTNPGTVTADDAPETGKPETAPATKVRPEVNPENDNIPSRNRGGFFENLKDSIADKFESFKDSALTWGKLVGIGLGVLIVIGALYLVISKTHGVANPTTIVEGLRTPPTVPLQTPIDLAHADWLSLVQITIVLLSVLVIIGVFGDAWNRKQVSDFVWVAFGTVLIMSNGLIEKVFVGFVGPGTPLNFDAKQLEFVVSAVITAIAITIAIVVSQQGGFDLTPLAGFLTILGSCGLLFGHLGALQVILGMPDSPVLPLAQVNSLIALKQFDQIGLSLTTYFLLGTGSLMYLVEMIRTITGMTGEWWQKLIYATTSLGGIFIYTISKNYLLSLGIPPMFTIVLAIVSATAIAFIYRTQTGRVNMPTGEGQITLRNAWIPPFDKVAVQLAPALLLIALTGRVI